ncbi:hypothetical protein ROJ8625_00413 [Roseivivax jejudonensis]|uniref:Periplasmic heavy metal sensor n=1 Tax=Roseivivax jejudonensis TaxID=1529041 RepID=A0A1X6Y8Z9_9RHOB|nr:periplasmic heavy metal sensor [Roseivivax jejudonensis]SLN13589.1 hypothetical protein ROJ8625_00413 [Roseivivax jejudonensis]
MARTSESGRRWLWPVLFVSLAANLLIAGIVLGAVLRDGQPQRDGRAGAGSSFPYYRALDEDQRAMMRREFRAALRDARDDDTASGEDRRVRFVEGYRQAAEVLRASPLDRAALTQILDAQARAAEMRRDRGQAILLDVLANMSAEERAAYADRLVTEIRRFEDK